MGRCPFLRVSIFKGLSCISPDNSQISFVTRQPYGLETSFGTDKTKCKYNEGRSCVYNFDENNRKKYGPGAPLYFERIWVNPAACRKALIPSSVVESGRVIDNCWPPEQAKRVLPVLELEKVQYCVNRWSHGQDWLDTGAYAFLMESIAKFGHYDGCYHEKDINKRLKALDVIFEQVKKDGRLKTGQEINTSYLREQDGTVIHVGPEKELYIGGGGIHRFAIAYILGLPYMPAKIGYIHKKALPYLDILRKEPAQESTGFNL